MRSFVGLLVVVGLIGGGAAWWYAHNSAHGATGFRTVQVERGNLLATISATGTIEPEEVIDIGAQVAGQIIKFGPDPRGNGKLIDYGSPVERDTVLAEIDPALYQAQVDRAKAQLESAQAALESANAQVASAQANVQKAEADLGQMKAKLYQSDRDWQRAQRLRPSGALADVDYDTAEATFRTNKATLAVGEATVAQNKAALKDAIANVAKTKAGVTDAVAALKNAEINLGYCTIKSPVKGVIVDRRVNIGQTVVSSLNAPSLFLLAKDLKRMQVWASVNEADIGNIHPKQAVTFTVDAYPGETFKGVVDQIRLNASMTQNVVTYTVVVTTDNSSGKLYPYLTANLQFIVNERKDVVLVPNSALRWKPQPDQIAPDAREEFAKKQGKRRPGASGETLPAQASKSKHDHTNLWIADGDFVRPISVQIGLSDGISTEIVKGDVRDGTEVVVGEAHQNGGEGTTNPFTPKLFGGGKKTQ
jgi:HlyD family secretion protein